MESASASVETLRKQILDTENSLRELREQLAQIESRNVGESAKNSSISDWEWPLSLEEYKRYGRQMIVPNIGIQGIKTCKTHSSCLCLI